MSAEAERHFVTGRDWARREGLPVEEGRCLLGLAQLAGAVGNGATPKSSAGRAEALFSAHGAELYVGRARDLRAARPTA